MAPHYPKEPAHPTDLSMPPPSDRIIHIDTAPPASSSKSHHADVAGVLRRNQACLQCRKRKLKCDAARPHCATCVRSYRHLLKTSPKSNPVLCCDYDDGGATHNDEGDKGEKASSSKSPSHNQSPDDDDGGGGKKKRKANGEGKRKKKDEQFEEERDRLTKKIEELEAQLSKNLPTPEKQQSASTGSQSKQTWPGGAQPLLDTLSASSPTAFLEMLSSAASSQPQNATSSSSNKSTEASNPRVFHNQGGTQAGLNPPDLFPRFAAFAYSGGASITETDLSPDATEESRRSSAYNITPGSGGEPSQTTNILSPGGVFNFSPGDATNFTNWLPTPAADPTSFTDSNTKSGGDWTNTETIDTMFAASINAQGQPNTGEDTNMDGGINMDGLQAGLDAAMQQQLLMDLFWPGWPINLPEPNVVNDLIEAFFDLVPNLPRVLHRARFLSRMALPPTHSNFPHPALIHAICAAAAAWCPPEVYAKSVRGRGNDFLDSTGMGMYGTDMFEGKGSKDNLTFGLRQASFAKEAVQEGLNTGNRLFDVVRAMIILCRVFIDDTRMLECWAYGGLVSRMLLPLGLNVRSAELSLKSVMLPPPADALEREERRAAVWMAFYHDTIASAASGWGTSMQLDELTTPLPVSLKDFETGQDDMEANPQDLESPDFWVKHPIVDPFVMVIKATVLMNRVNKFARRWKNRHMRPDDDYDGLNRPEFRELANSIACFQMSFPPSMRNVGKLTPKGKLDIDLIAAQMLPHAAIICLHEPFADLNDPTDQAARRMLGATQAIVSIVQQLASVVGEGGSNFTQIMHSSASVCLVTSARTSLLFLRHALNMGDMAAAQTHRTDCEMIRMALSQFGLKFKIGHHHSQLIEYFLDRATNPTYEKLQAHYPDHPRSGAPDLTPTSNLGLCVTNALNIKRGFWRLPKSSASTGASPFGSTPESMNSGNGSHTSRPQPSSSSSVSQHLSDGDSPNNPRDSSGSKNTYTFFDSFQKPGGLGNSSEAMDTDSPPNGSSTDNRSKSSFGNQGATLTGQSNPFAGGANIRQSPDQPASNIPEYNFVGIAMQIVDSVKQKSNLSETGLCDMAPPRPKKQTSQPQTGTQIPIEKVISSWDGITPVDTQSNANANNTNNNPSFGVNHPFITPVTKEMDNMITAARTVGPDGHIHIWPNITEADLIAERVRVSNNNRSQLSATNPMINPLNKEWEDKITNTRVVGKDGHMGVCPFSTEAELSNQQQTANQQPNLTNFDISLPGVPPVTKEMEAKITEGRRSGYGYVGDLGIYTDKSQSDLLAEKQRNGNINNNGSTSTSSTKYDNSLFGIPPVTSEMHEKIRGKDTIGPDGQYPVLLNTTEQELLLEAQKQQSQRQQTRLNQYNVNNNMFQQDGSNGNVQDIMASLYRADSGSGSTGLTPFWEHTGTGSDTQNQGMNSSFSLNPEMQVSSQNVNDIRSSNQDQELTQEQIMININKNGNLPSDDQIGFKEGQIEKGRVGEMLRMIYE